MSADGDMLRPVSARSRSTRSHSLKQQSQPILFKQRSKRTMSLPSKPLLPLISIQRCDDNWDGENDGDENELNTNEEEMAWYTPVVGLSCSLVIFAWSCVLAYYSKK